MTGTLEARFLGTPVIIKDGQEVFFSYNKVNALVYYVLVRGTAMRDELSGILWADRPDHIAKKNLRNAIYEAKKVLGSDIFISPRKAVIKLNPEAVCQIDVNIFRSDPENHIDLYKGDFLQGFYIKDSGEYEDWYLAERAHLREIYLEAVETQLWKARHEGRLGAVEKYARILITNDPYEEEVYRLLLQVYGEQGKVQQAIRLYEEMKKRFAEDLLTVPGEATEAIVAELQQRGTNPSQPGLTASTALASQLTGRQAELDMLLQNIDSFIGGNKAVSVMVTGESGSGKSTLLARALTVIPPEISVVRTNCYQLEKSFLLRPWTGIMEELVHILAKAGEAVPEFELRQMYKLFPQMDAGVTTEIKLIESRDILQFEAVFHTLSTIIDSVSRHRRIIMVFEDVEWMDPLSLSLLSSFILRKQTSRVLFFLTGRESNEKPFQHFLASAVMHKKLQLITLNPLSKADSKQLAEEAGLRWTEELGERLMTESEGNLFLLAECLRALKNKGDLKVITSNMQTLFQERCLELTEVQQRIVTFIALFYDGAPLSMIEAYMEQTSLQLVEELEILRNKHFLISLARDEITYQVRQQKLKEYIQMQLSPEKWRVLHAYIGELWEKRLVHSRQDLHVYQHLVYHFGQAQQLLKTAQYKLKSLAYYLNFSHELFPILGTGDTIENTGVIYFTETDTLGHLNAMDALLQRLTDTYGGTREVRELELAYLHVKGRYFIREGNYEKGTRYILELIEQSRDLQNRDYALMGYKQMIYYDIQTDNVEEMKNYIEVALDLAVECNYHKEVGILLRLKGLNMIMQGNFTEAERLLNESVATFMVTQSVARRYALNIAAAYNYLGEIRRGTGQFEDAIDWYEKALTICADKQAFSSWVVFSCNAGVASFNLGRYEQARTYFQQAYALFDRYDFYWRRPIVRAYLGLLDMMDEKEREAEVFLDEALAELALMNNPREIGMVNMAIALIKKNYPQQKISYHFPGPVSMYAGKAFRYLDPYRDSYERNMMEELQ